MEIIWGDEDDPEPLVEALDVGLDTGGFVVQDGERVQSIGGEEVLRSKLFRVLDSESGLVFVRDTFDEMIAAEEQMLEASFREVQGVSPDSFGG